MHAVELSQVTKRFGHSIVAVDNTGLTTTSSIVSVNVTAVSPPVNDPFSGRITISGNVATVTGTNVNSSAQAGEHDHAGYDAQHSVWWTWTPSLAPGGRS